MDKSLIIFLKDKETGQFYQMVKDDSTLPVSIKDQSVGYCRIAFLVNGEYFVELMDIERIYLFSNDSTCVNFQVTRNIKEKSNLNQNQQKLYSIEQYNFIKNICIPLIIEYNGFYESILNDEF